MLAILYNMWGILAGVSTAISIIAASVSVKQSLSKSKDLPVAVKVLLNLVFACSCAVVLSSFAIGTMFSKAPRVYGKTVREATQIFNDVGLKLVLSEGMPINDSTLNMTVIGQNYEGDQPIPKGTEITVYVDSTGIQAPQTTIVVPNVVGEQYVNALETLSESGLRYLVFVSDEKDVSLENAYIVSQSIVEGSNVPEGSILKLGLSSKEENISSSLPSADMIDVPGVVDMEEAEAVKMLEDLGLTAQVWWLTGTDESLDCYYIIGQSIPAGSSVHAGTLIELERSGIKLGTPVTVPNVVGMEQMEATRLLKNMGLNFQVWWTEENNIPIDQYYIIDQSIPAGSSVSAGTLVKLELSVTKP